MNKYVIKAKHELIDDMIEPIVSALKEAEANGKALYAMNLVLEEVLVNIVNYAYDNDDGTIDISYDINKENRTVKVTIKDSGKAFNPLDAQDPPLHQSASERKVGGLGIYIVKNLVDDIKYSRVDEHNVLEFSKNF